MSSAVTGGLGVLLEADDVSYRYPGRKPSPLALDALSFRVTAGRNFAIVGESGAGKTTLLRVLLGLARPTGGVVRFGSTPLDLGDRALMRSYRRAVQAVFQDPYSSLNPRMTIERIVGEPLRSLGIAGGAEARARVCDVLVAVGLDASITGRYPRQFSGGQRQRIAIARAIVAEPRLLVADEPVSALDLSTRIQILELLDRLGRQLDFTLVMVSHDLATVAALCDELCVLEHGRIVEHGPTESVLSSARSDHTRRLLASVPRLPTT